MEQSACLDSTMEKRVLCQRTLLKEPLISAKIEEEWLVENEIVKTEPFLDEYDTVEEDSSMLAQVKEERDFKLYPSSDIGNKCENHMEPTPHLPLSAVSSRDSILSEEEDFMSLAESKFPIVLLRPLNISDHKASNFDTTMEEPTHSQVQELKKPLFSGILKEELVVEDGLQEGLCQDELQAMERNTKEELILEMLSENGTVVKMRLKPK